MRRPPELLSAYESSVRQLGKPNVHHIGAALHAVVIIFEAWSDEPRFNNGAAVRVSLVCFGEGKGAMLDGLSVTEIHADLTAGNEKSGTLDLTRAKTLAENLSTSFAGTKKYGDFDIPGDLARRWLAHPNPNGHPNAEVVKP